VLLRWPAGSVNEGPADVVVLVVVIRVLVGVVVVVVMMRVLVLVLVLVEVGPPCVVVTVTLPPGWPGMPGTPRQAPNSLRHPAPQNSMEDPHQKNWEQQGPKLGLPMHIVLLPHMPLVVTWREPVGITMGVVDVEVVLTVGVVVVVVVGCWAVVLVVLVVLLVLVVLVVLVVGRADVVEVVVGCTTLGHPQVPYCVWQSKSGWQWSTESPQKP